MCTPWTSPRLVRWRVRDWALSFLACGIHLEGEKCCHPFKVSTINTKKEKRPIQNSHQVKENGTAASDASRNNSNVDSEDSCWPHFQDEDYIVFCFKEDGAFDVLRDEKSDTQSPRNSQVNSSPRNSHVNSSPRKVVKRMLSYGGEMEVERVYDHSQEISISEDDCIVKKFTRSITSAKKTQEEEGLDLDASRGVDPMEESEDSGMVSAESNGSSNQSDNSTSSFAFPVLRWEWSGSPVEMPKSNRGVHLRKHRARLHCCRFRR